MEEININAETVLQRNDDDFLFTEVDGEMVVMHANSGKYLGLNPVSKDIWEHLESPTPYSALIDKLLSEYDIERSTCEEDTTAVLKTMVKTKMVHIK